MAAKMHILSWLKARVEGENRRRNWWLVYSWILIILLGLLQQLWL